jgi:CubicO group peptidase (beta-lactamase class C family)
VLGYLVEAVSGVPFEIRADPDHRSTEDEDIHFTLPPEKLPRLAKTYGLKDGKLAQTTLDAVGSVSNVPFGGMGLYSTIEDARFGQMLLNNGQLNRSGCSVARQWS